jgi:hypothetical protein
MPNPALDRDRVEFLQARNKIGSVGVPAWPRHEKELPVVEAPVEWLRFSTLNHRTRAEQRREVARARRLDLFTADPLGPDAQDAQYRILTKQEGFSALRADLRERRQQEPAIITAEGVLINGNRRAAALRSLYADDSWLPARYVRCLLLPEDATSDEIVDLEAELQVARDFRQEYSWINEALLIEELFERENKDWHRVAVRVHRTVNEVRATHEKLQQVHQLVELSQGARHHVDFDANESAFDELAKHVKNKSAREVSSVRATYFLGTLSGVQYRKLRHLRRPDAAELVLDELRSAGAQPLLAAAASSFSEDAVGDELDELLGEPESRNELEELLTFLATKRAEEVILLSTGESVITEDALATLNAAITAAAEEAGEMARDKTVVQEPMRRIDSAISSLSKGLLAVPRARVFDDWDETAYLARIDELEGLVAQLRGVS